MLVALFGRLLCFSPHSYFFDSLIYRSIEMFVDCNVISEQEVQTDVQVDCLVRNKMAEKQHMPQGLMGYWSDSVPVHYTLSSFFKLAEFV